jgi:predicted dithiol-disulfide oxidoreductase (DUF899 family)
LATKPEHRKNRIFLLIPEKKLKCRLDKTKERRKGPGLKARVIAFLFEGPEGPCSLREYKTASACFIPCGSAKSVDD